MFDFVMEYNKCDFSTAKEILAEKVGVPAKIRNEAKIIVKLQNKANFTEYIVKQFLSQNRVYTIKNDYRNEMWIYDNGIYVPHGRSHIKMYVRALIHEFYSIGTINNIILKIESDSYIDEDKFFRKYNENQLVVKNGILDVVKRTLSPFDPEKVFFNKLNLFYDEKMLDFPEGMEFLQSTLACQDDIDTVQEIFGYSLLDNCKFKKAFLFVGSEDNGKSVLIDYLSSMVGKENISNVSMQSIDGDQFSASELFGKMLNINADIPASKINESSMLKNLIAGDMISANRKFLTPIKFRNRAKIIFAANNVPETEDESDGFFTRWKQWY